MKKLSVNELTRLAFVYAEQDRETWLSCAKGEPQEDIERNEKLLKQLKEYRLKRWGKTKLEVVMEEARPITTKELFHDLWKQCKHEWGPSITVYEPNFKVAYASYQICKKCQYQLIENWCETRATGGTQKIYPPGTIK